MTGFSGHQKKRWIYTTLIVSLPFLLGGMYMGWTAARNISFVHNYKTAPGIIYQGNHSPGSVYRDKYGNKHQNFGTYFISYRYFVGGNSFEHTERSSYDLPNGQTSVFYHSSKPWLSHLYLPDPAFDLSVMALCFGGAVLMGWMSYIHVKTPTSRR